ncbi:MULTISPECIES: hypothetical protein [Chryseobacterium]|uniref:Glycosyltransferase involved in cell wall biosynthesis n=1 Tax=Chryseobacterium camelliae TaxID=1265445 RepID=A0ABU0TNC0_9FLAO|nr:MULTISPECIES: hypothetical protein [Chryseobacterium]MDT3407611.1 glycosyltransferase involved in cell wall biosynthesis [Pseudacidovorax intermedius]MDQ1098537.1 glycosyltransferase involved in cell wall biosynthesis [Chryseobacterium camelliae]MDQ1102461.1 glycosyltransferase involved in cell wall biosynthesis [Chryseobacterium sp. SORGH_AS_1048]MDR6085894.1 glycosyltransferase involved in cell wall biosynthesis [Chryseobacterium sp. SORGH_AS_0909]MDR6130261.1 glycosyltransferase involved
MEKNIDKNIHSNKIYFESSVVTAQRLFDEGLYEDCINFIEKTASFGWFNFSGYYKSESLEILLSEIQKKIIVSPPLHKKKSKTGKILQICSKVYTSGGHSKLLYNWIKNDNTKKHTILSTRLSEEELKAVSEFYIDSPSNLLQISVKSSSKIESIHLLNEQPLNEYDMIVLHVHPDEVITNIVLSQKYIQTPVFFVNHADHVFWLGTSISDIILQIRESNIPLDMERRGISLERQFFFPIPVENTFNIEECKENTGKFIQLLSTGTAYKYNPNDSHNFLREAYKIVEENPEVIFNIVGIDQDSEYAAKYKHARIVLHGILPASQLAEIEKRADIYVEGFPMASFTALLQTALRKVPFVLHYRPLPLFKLFNDNKDHHVIYPENLEEWHNEVNKLIHDKNYRKEVSDIQYQYILNNFSLQVWKSRVQKLYDTANNIAHRIWSSSSDRYYDGDNEKLLVTIDRRTFSHYSFTERMSLKGKYFVYKTSRFKNKNIHYFSSKKQLLNYFLKK